MSTTTVKISELPELDDIKESTIIPVVDAGLNKTITGGTLRNYVSTLPGNTGPTGPRGPAGPNGYTGSQGITGYAGSRGATGASGLTGITGPRGYTGSAGEDALWRFQGAYDNFATYNEGDIVTYQGQSWYRLNGDNLATGFPPGQANAYWNLVSAKGTDGEQGLTGYVGSRGIAGFTGSVGIGYAGSQGTPGIAGSAGPAGYAGSQGYVGSVGTRGLSGFTGSKGDAGFVGSAGTPGEAAAIGYTGSQGNIGYTGSQGLQGLTGNLDYIVGDAGYLYRTETGLYEWDPNLSIGIIYAGGGANTSTFNIELDGGSASGTQTESTDGGDAGSTYNSALSVVSVTGSYTDLVDKPNLSNENIVVKTAATGTVDYNCDITRVFYNTVISSDFIVNLNNLTLPTNQSTVVEVVLDQNETPHMITELKIDGVIQSINWINGIIPTGTASRKDIVSFKIMNVNDAYVVFGQMITYG